MDENILISEFSKNWKWVVVRGIVSLIFGLAVVFYPFTAVKALTLFFGAFIFADGVFAILSIFISRAARAHFWSLLFEGLAGIAIGIITFLLPGVTLYGLVILVSAWALVTGIFEIVTAIRLRKIIEGEFFMIVSGILSIIFAIVIFLMPTAGIIAIIYLIGIYAIMFGIMLVIFGFSLRKYTLKA